MIRGIAVVAVGGAMICVASLSVATAMGHLGWHIPDVNWMDDDSSDAKALRLTGKEPIITRALTWTGSDKLTIEMPAQITYTQGPSSAITVSGPDALVNHVVISGDVLKLDVPLHTISVEKSLKIAITGPSLHDFRLESAQTLDIENLSTDSLSVRVEGAGKVSAHGTAHALDLRIEGAGDADLAGLALTDAKIEIDGLGNVTAAPTGDASVEINGAGNVKLTQRPAHLSSEINGGGEVSQPDAPSEQKL